MKQPALTVLLIFVWAASALAGPRASSSYIMPVECFGSSAVHRSSASYSQFGVMSGLTLGEPGSTSYSLREGFIPTAVDQVLLVLVTSMEPDTGYNTGMIDITSIRGAGFAAGASVSLSRTGEADLLATSVTVASTQELTCSFDLSGAVTGWWDLTVTNPGGMSGTLPSAFMMRTWATISMALNTPNPFDPGSETTTIVYRLDQDTDVTLAIFSTTADLLWKRSYIAGSNGGRAGDNSVLWNGLTDFNERAANGVYLLRVINRGNGRVLAKGKIAVLSR